MPRIEPPEADNHQPEASDSDGYSPASAAALIWVLTLFALPATTCGGCLLLVNDSIEAAVILSSVVGIGCGIYILWLSARWFKRRRRDAERVHQGLYILMIVHTILMCVLAAMATSVAFMGL